MLDGLWHIKYTVSGKEYGGVIVVDDGRALGGDGGFIFIGKLTVRDAIVSGELRIRRVVDSVEPALPGLINYTLKVSGRIDAKHMDLSGTSTALGNDSLQLHATKYAD